VNIAHKRELRVPARLRDFDLDQSYRSIRKLVSECRFMSRRGMEECAMANENAPAPAPVPDPAERHDGDEERIPFFQQLLDNPFLLLFLGVTIPTVFYVIWGIIEVANIPIAK
jgi:hypothetical protein